jgi:hypothetical protein
MELINAASYCVCATDPFNAAKVEYECMGFELAHEKAAELRMAGFKNVVMSLAEAPDSNETAS